MRQFHVLPVPALRPFIDRLWGWESEPGEVIELPTLLPGTGAELYFHYRQPFRRLTTQGLPVTCPQAHLLCLRRRPVALCASGEVGFIAVRFRAGMLHRFTAIPAGELIDHQHAVDELWGGAGKAVMQGVSECATPSSRLRLIQDFLLDCLRAKAADALAEHAVSALYRESASISIDQLATHLKIGRRQMERRVLALTGQSPAELRRLGRLQKSVRALLLAPEAALLDVALANGYYDQSHFSRDCRELAHDSPGRLLQAARAKTHFYNTPHGAFGKMTTPVSI
jgi:AraC-like DNA-binding protein